MLRHHALRASQKGPKLSFSYVTSFAGSTTTSQTFSSVSFGSAESTRRIYVFITAFSNTNGATISSVTIGGVAATVLMIKTSGGSVSAFMAGVAVAAVPTGTTGDIVVTFSAALSVAKTVHVYRVTNQVSSIASAMFASSSIGTPSGTTLSRTVATVANGFVLGILHPTAARSVTLTGGTQHTSGSSTAHTGSTLGTGADVTFTWNWTTALQTSTTIASFNP